MLESVVLENESPLWNIVWTPVMQSPVAAHRWNRREEAMAAQRDVAPEQKGDTNTTAAEGAPNDDR